MNPRIIGILGGTFDPIHKGHLHIATTLLERLPLDEIRLLPCHTPVHRDPPIASPEDRLAMARLACADLPKICVDDHEIKRQGPSYMIDTLRDLKTEMPEAHLCLILGEDAFFDFDRWYQWESIINFCHLIIVNRPNSKINYRETLINFIFEFQSQELTSLRTQLCGKIFFCDIPPLDISATQLREQLSQEHYDEKIISPLVLQYISHHHLYRTPA